VTAFYYFNVLLSQGQGYDCVKIVERIKEAKQEKDFKVEKERRERRRK
jgi:hypothetical protein